MVVGLFLNRAIIPLESRCDCLPWPDNRTPCCLVNKPRGGASGREESSDEIGVGSIVGGGDDVIDVGLLVDFSPNSSLILAASLAFNEDNRPPSCFLNEGRDEERSDEIGMGSILGVADDSIDVKSLLDLSFNPIFLSICSFSLVCLALIFAASLA